MMPEHMRDQKGPEVAPTHVDDIARLKKWLRRVLIMIGGTLLVLIGIAMLPLPGPGFAVIIGGFALLSLEFAWAAVILRRLKRSLKQGAELTNERGRRRFYRWVEAMIQRFRFGKKARIRPRKAG